MEDSKNKEVIDSNANTLESMDKEMGTENTEGNADFKKILEEEEKLAEG